MEKSKSIDEIIKGLEQLQERMEFFKQGGHTEVCYKLKETYLRDLELYRLRYGCTNDFYAYKNWFLHYEGIEAL